MRVIRLRKRIEKELHLLVLVFLMDVASEAIVAACNELRRRLNRMLAQMFLQKFVRNPTAPELIGFGVIFWPRRLLTGVMAFLQEAANRHGNCFSRRRHGRRSRDCGRKKNGAKRQ